MIQYSKDFLLKLDQQKERTVYVRLTALTQDELPVEEIQGRVTGGSINLDGKSAVRRTCSITLVGQDLQIHDYFWAMKNKFKVEIGLENHIDSNYEDIIWFKQGIFYITSFSMNESTNNFTISISGKDKMAKLNGDLGGNLMAETDFGQYDQVNADGSVSTIKVPIRTIITQAIMQYAQEPVGNIIINDLPDYGFELWDYRGVGQNGENIDLFYFYEIDEYGDTSLKQCILGNQDNNIYSAYTNNNDSLGKYTLQNIPREFLYYPSTLLPSSQLCYFKRGDSETRKYYIAKVEYGQTAGYHGTELVYPDELIAKVGDSITTGLLDKLTTMLGEFEYFYDIDGKFIFQKKKTYIQNLFTPITSNEVRSFTAASQYAYRFEDAELNSAFSNQPQIGNIKNDYSIWGTKKSVNGNELPIHARYAIAHKPERYKCLDHYSLIPLLWVKPMVDSNDIGAISVINVGHVDGDQNGDDLFVQAANAADIEHNSYIITTYLKPENDDNYKLYTFRNGIYCPVKSQSKYNLYKDVNQLYIKDGYEFKEETTISAEPRDLGNGAKYYYKDREEAFYEAIEEEPNYKDQKVDWRELLYIMAEDYYQHHENPRFPIMIQNNNPQFSQGKTGYEGFYIDIMGFWRQLYNPKFEEEIAFETLPMVAEEDELKEVYAHKEERYLKGLKTYSKAQINDLIFDSVIDDEKINFLNTLYKKSWQPPEFKKDSEGNKTTEIDKEGYWYLEPIAFTEEVDKEKNNVTYIKNTITKFEDIRFKIPNYSGLIGEQYYEYVSLNDDPEKEIILYQLNFDNNVNYYPNISVYFENENNSAELYRFDKTNEYIEGFYAIGEDFNYCVRKYTEEIQLDNTTKYIASESTARAIIAQDKKSSFIDNGIYKYWNELAVYYPEDLVFWFDFLDTAGELDKFSIHELGNRTKVEQGSNGVKISSIFYSAVPTVEFVNYGEKSVIERTKDQSITPDYIRINLNSIEDLFTISSQGASAASRIDEMLYQNATLAETINITTMPIYYLEPNIRIYVKSPNTKIDGDYIVTNFSIPLGYNGTMSLSATKVINLLK